jgi:MFS family permease
VAKPHARHPCVDFLTARATLRRQRRATQRYARAPELVRAVRGCHKGTMQESRAAATDLPRLVARMRLLPLITRYPPLTRHQWRVMGVLGAANLIDSYDLAILGLALPQIQMGLGVDESQIGALTAFVRLGVIPAIVLTVLADRIGRRRLLLVTILAFAACTFLTAFARDEREFAALQFLARIFIAAEGMLAIVVIAEEFGASARGWGIGMLGALGTLGYGLASIVFSFVNLLPFGWRALYVVGVLPLLLLAWFRRSLTETRRFEAHRAAQKNVVSGWRGLVQPVRNMIRMYPGRMVALCAALLPIAFVFETSMLFVSKTLQQEHGYAPAWIALMYLTVGAIAPIGNIAAGTLGDRFGRKRVMIVGILVNAVAVALFYNTDGIWLPLLWGLMLVSLTFVLVLFAALGSELFPTSYRSTASGTRAVVATLGAAFGLWLEGYLYEVTGRHGTAITWMLVVTPLAPLVVAWFVPETANQELEHISPERRVETTG